MIASNILAPGSRACLSDPDVPCRIVSATISEAGTTYAVAYWSSGVRYQVAVEASELVAETPDRVQVGFRTDDQADGQPAA